MQTSPIFSTGKQFPSRLVQSVSRDLLFETYIIARLNREGLILAEIIWNGSLIHDYLCRLKVDITNRSAPMVSLFKACLSWKVLSTFVSLVLCLWVTWCIVHATTISFNFHRGWNELGWTLSGKCRRRPSVWWPLSVTSVLTDTLKTATNSFESSRNATKTILSSSLQVLIWGMGKYLEYRLLYCFIMIHYFLFKDVDEEGPFKNSLFWDIELFVSKTKKFN